MKQKLVLVVSGIMFLFIGLSFAAEKKQEPKKPAAKQEAAPAVKAPVVSAQPSPAEIEKRKKMIKEAKEKLNNLIWQIEVNQMTSEPKKQSYKDILSFIDNKVSSKELVSEGFSSTNYTVNVSGNAVVWETMQTSEKKGIAFWKGELEGDVMRGVLSRHINEKTVKDYSFASTAKEAALPLEAVAVPLTKEEAKLKEETVKAVPIEAENVQAQGPVKEEKPVAKETKKKGLSGK